MSNLTNKQQNQQQQGRTVSTKTSLRELSEFHPRLSMRAAVSNKINEEALNAIQLQQQPESPKTQKLSGNNENQGNDLIQSLTRFVGSDGLMKDTVDLRGYAELMQCEVSASHQILLLKILVATLKSDSSMSKKMVDCEALMIVLGLWLSSVEQDKLLESVVVEKILEILSRLNFTVDLLVKYKFGRVIKKITQQKDKITLKNKTTSLNIEMATKLFDSWSALANQSEIPNVPRRKSEEDIEKKPKETINESIKRPESSVNESVKRLQSSVNPTMKRPESPDNPVMKRPLTIVIEDDNDEVKKIKYSETGKKSVRFPEMSEDLCKVIIFERAPEEYEYLSDGSASRDNYLHADAGEASRAFGTSFEDEEISDFNLKPWKELETIDGIPSERPDGIDSEEKIIQHQRERSVLSVNYYSFSDIPLTPLEEDVDTATDDSMSVKIIPIRPNEKIIHQKVVIKEKPRTLELPKMFTPDLFNNLMTNNSNFNTLLNPFASSSKGPSRDPKSKFNQPNPSWSSSNNLNNPNLHNYEPKNTRHYSPTTPASPKESEYRGYSAKSICNYYRPGKPFSCRLGSSCRFIHQD